MNEEDCLLIDVHNLLAINSFALDQSEKNIDVLQEILKACKEGKRNSFNRCVLHELCDVMDLIVLLKEMDKYLTNPSISQECQTALYNLKKETENIISDLKVLENELCHYASCPLITNGN